MPVFISHRKQDDAIAIRVYKVLSEEHGIECYLDDFDPEAASTNNITKTILKALEKATHLLAVVTDKTRGSWWVPFEIGVAQHGARRIVTYKSGLEPLPEYLEEWPILKEKRSLNVFAAMYKRDSMAKQLILNEDLGLDEIHAQMNDANLFHEILKERLR